MPQDKAAAHLRRIIAIRLAVTRDMGMDDQAQTRSAVQFAQQICPQMSEEEAVRLVREVMDA